MMQGYGQPQTGYTTPQVPNGQGGMQQDPYQGGTYPYSAGYPGQQTPSYTYPAQQGGSGSYIPQTPYSPGYTSPGYQPQNNGYPQQNGSTAVNGYPQQGGNAAMNGYPNAYAQPGGYVQGGYSQPGTYPQGGTYPQNPYPQGGYAQPGRTAQSGYAQGGYAQPGVYQAYNPYGQMGRTQPQGQQPDPATQIPLNGGGYVPQRVPVRRRGFEMKDWYLILAGVLLIALFAAAVLILKSSPLKIATILLAAGSAAVLWVKPLTAENKRLTYTILALALCLLTILSFVIKPAKDAMNNDALPAETAETAGGSSAESGGVPSIPLSGGEQQALLEEPTPTPENTDNQLMERLVAFFSYWSANRQDEMLTLCAPSWQSKQENPRTALFALIANRFPKDCTPESITGTQADTSRRVTVTTTIDRKNGKPEEKFRMTILMVKEGGDWYVDPQSLQTYETVETPDPNVTETPAPTATPYVDANTTLYYNPKGGEYYHLDASCKIINAKYVPLQGTFTYSQLNDEPYSKLKPCNVCGAPLRED